MKQSSGCYIMFGLVGWYHRFGTFTFVFWRCSSKTLAVTQMIAVSLRETCVNLDAVWTAYESDLWDDVNQIWTNDIFYTFVFYSSAHFYLCKFMKQFIVNFWCFADRASQYIYLSN